MTAQFYENLADFNKVELCNGIGEALDIGEKKKEENSLVMSLLQIKRFVKCLSNQRGGHFAREETKGDRRQEWDMY